MTRYKLAACTGQHIGDRGEQQDRIGVFTSPRLPGSALFVLADGMGGKTGGAMAAQQVISTAKSLFEAYTPAEETPAQLLTQLASESHTIIRLSAMTEEKEPHSTMVALLLQPGRADWAHVGDSRLYRFHNGGVVKRTVDHSFVEQMVQQGRLTREQAVGHRLSNLLVNALGTEKPANPTLDCATDLQPGDCFLLCSDGLWAYFDDDELGQVLGNNPPRAASEYLIQQARERAEGHGDNCTLAIAKLEAPAPAAAFPKLRG